MARPLVIGAVMYDPKVSVIWEIIRDFFDQQACPTDLRFYSTYEQQVSELVDGRIDIAWNSPLAWLDSQRRTRGSCRAIAMRDTDRDRASHLIARIDGPVGTLADLAGRTLAAGASDSPQANLIPRGLLRSAGLIPGRDVQIREFDVLVGKHGDHVGGELEAVQSLLRGASDAAALLDLNWTTWTKDGTIDPASVRIVATTPLFDHCVFTVRGDADPALIRGWTDALFSMRYDNPQHRRMMELEGLTAWLPGRTTGFGPLAAAVAAEAFFERRERPA
jgi:ABC-type phosphate/phosphonate transport system substrate-binding protein